MASCSGAMTDWSRRSPGPGTPRAPETNRTGGQSRRTWPDRRLIELFGIEHPILLAPMVGPGTPQLAIAVAEVGGLGSLPCAMLGPDQMRADVRVFGARVRKPINLNFFAHTAPGSVHAEFRLSDHM